MLVENIYKEFAVNWKAGRQIAQHSQSWKELSTLHDFSHRDIDSALLPIESSPFRQSAIFLEQSDESI